MDSNHRVLHLSLVSRCLDHYLACLLQVLGNCKIIQSNGENVPIK